MGLGRWDEAAECLLNSAEYADQWGSQLFDQLCDSALDVALDALHRRHIAEPTSAMWIEQLGITYFNGNRYAEAKQWIAKTLEENEDADTYPYLALCSARMGDYEGYSEALKRGEQLDSTSIDMLEVSAMVEMDWGHYDKALEQANKLVDKQIDDASAYLLRGDILLAKGLAAEALDDYITASVLEEDVRRQAQPVGEHLEVEAVVLLVTFLPGDHFIADGVLLGVPEHVPGVSQAELVTAVVEINAVVAVPGVVEVQETLAAVFVIADDTVGSADLSVVIP